jgi:ParB-like chromosome segregation protein Spo0J
MNQIVELPPSELCPDPDYQPREGLDLEHLKRLRCSNPVDWPTLLVTPAGEEVGYFIIDGFHRYAVARELELPTLQCSVLAEAGYEEAVAANLKHGLPLSIDERKHFARWLKEHYPEMSVRDIAARAGLSTGSVSKLLTTLVHDERESGDEAVGNQRTADISADQPDAFGKLFLLVKRAYTENTGVSKFAQFFSGKDDSRQRAEAVRNRLEHYEGEERALMVQAARIVGEALIEGARLLKQPVS